MRNHLRIAVDNEIKNKGDSLKHKFRIIHARPDAFYVDELKCINLFLFKIRYWKTYERHAVFWRFVSLQDAEEYIESRRAQLSHERVVIYK